MITEAQIAKLVAEKLEDTEYFCVDVKVDGANKISVEIDGPGGVPINQCVAVSRHIEGSYDREVEDFELSVSSPGVGRPLKVFKQYEANVGRNLQVTLEDGKVIEGALKEVSEQVIKVETKKTKKQDQQLHELNLEDIKQTKVLVKF